MLNKLTQQYSLSKTIRFELRPYNNKVCENIKKKGIVSADEIRNGNYQKAKTIIDDYHRAYIETRLVDLVLDPNVLTEFQRLTQLSDKTESDTKVLSELQTKMRKVIADHLTQSDQYKHIDKKELIRDDLIDWLNSEEGRNQRKKTDPEVNIENDIEIIQGFRNFVTYFQGFFENRKNIYSAEEHSTAISYRIIHENLPKFISNIRALQDIAKKYPDLKAQLETAVVRLQEANLILTDSLDELFSLANLPLSQVEIDRFNRAVGGDFIAGEKIQGLNETINLYRQQTKFEDEKGMLIKPPRINHFQQLYKQILSDTTNNFIFETIENDMDLIHDLTEAITHFSHFSPIDKDHESVLLTNYIPNLLAQLKETDLRKIWLRNDAGLTAISNAIFGNYSFIKVALDHYYQMTNNAYQSHKAPTKKMEAEKDKWLKKAYISFIEINDALMLYRDTLDDYVEEKSLITKNCLLDYFNDPLTTIDLEGHKKNQKEINLFTAINKNELALKALLDNFKIEYKKNTEINQQQLNNLIRQDKNAKKIIKSYLDQLITLLHFIKPLYLKEVKNDEGELLTATTEIEPFYASFTLLYDYLKDVIPLYTKVRNYITKKSYSLEKFKINFDNPQFLDGWDANKESDYTAVLLRKIEHRIVKKATKEVKHIHDDPYYLYYLAIMNNRGKDKKVFEEFPMPKEGEAHFEKMHYKLLPNPHMQMPRVFFSKKGLEMFKPTEDILRIYKNKTFQLGDHFNQEDLHKMIGFYKEKLKEHPDWQIFEHVFPKTEHYNNIGEFFNDVADQGYRVKFAPISQNYLEELIEKEQIHLFKLYNKDFSPYSTGRKNLHTLYWEAIFSEDNLKETIFKLDGGAELFYRPASLERNITHPRKIPIKTKTDNAHDKIRTFEYDIIKNKRFTENKFHFHVPITLNFKAKGSGYINNELNPLLQKSENINIIGIDRGERHLLYISVINQKGDILHQESLNIINHKTHKVDYQKKLHESEIGRDEARKAWQEIETIKDLKAGYLSFVVNKIAELVIQYNAVIAMEDLNFGFKRGRFKIEKQVYQKFEKALIDKLNFLVFKHPEEQGGRIQPGLRNALQLTNKFDSFKKLGKQSGIIFYVPAAYTSKIDPTTGFVNLLTQELSYQSIEKSKALIESFDAIRYHSKEDYFKFNFTYKNLTNRANNLRKQEWALIADNVERYNYDKYITVENEEYYKRNKPHMVASALKALFNKHLIDLTQMELKTAIIDINDAEFYKELLFNLRVLLAIRYNDSDNNDFILSPVKNRLGITFDSRVEEEKSQEFPYPLPTNGDANGAYHIALLGKIIIERIKAHDFSTKRRLDLLIKQDDWFNTVQSKSLDLNR